MHKITLIAWETRQKMSVSHKMPTRQAGLEEKLQIPAAAESLRSWFLEKKEEEKNLFKCLGQYLSLDIFT